VTGAIADVHHLRDSYSVGTSEKKFDHSGPRPVIFTTTSRGLGRQGRFDFSEQQQARDVRVILVPVMGRSLLAARRHYLITDSRKIPDRQSRIFVAAFNIKATDDNFFSLGEGFVRRPSAFQGQLDQVAILIQVPEGLIDPGESLLGFEAVG